MTLTSESFTSRRVTFLRGGVLILGGVHLWQAILLSRQLELLRPFSHSVSPEVRLFFAAVWGVSWIALFGLSLWRPVWFDRLMPAAAAVNLIYQLVMVWLADSAVARMGWPITLLWNSLFLLLTIGHRLPWRHQKKHFFRKTEW